MQNFTLPGVEPMNAGQRNPLTFGSTIANYGVPSVPVPAPVTTPSYSSSGGAPVGPTGVGMDPVSTNLPQSQWGGVGNMIKNTMLTQSGGLNMNNLGNLAETIGAFGQLWSGIQQNRIAKESLKFQKQAYQTNLENQQSGFNLALEDRVTSRYAQNGRSAEDAQAFINKYKLGE